MKRLKSILANPAPFGAALLPGTCCYSKVPKILITIDDGPCENTPDLLKELAQRNLKTVFFVNGSRALKYRDELLQCVSDGHFIGNHLWEHSDIRIMPKHRLREEIEGTHKVIESVQRNTGIFVRPPYGNLSFPLFALRNQMQFRVVLWSLLTYDYERNLELFKFVVAQKLKSNSIVVLHNQPELKQLYPYFLDVLVETANRKNFSFGSQSECL